MPSSSDYTNLRKLKRIQNDSDCSIKESEIYNDYSCNEPINTISFSNISVINDIIVGGNIFVHQYNGSDISNNSYIYAENITTSGNVIVGEDLSISKNAFISGETLINGILTVQGDININNRLFTTSDVSLGGKLFVYDESVFDNNAYFNYDTSFGGFMFCNGDLIPAPLNEFLAEGAITSTSSYTIIFSNTTDMTQIKQFSMILNDNLPLGTEITSVNQDNYSCTINRLPIGNTNETTSFKIISSFTNIGTPEQRFNYIFCQRLKVFESTLYFSILDKNANAIDTASISYDNNNLELTLNNLLETGPFQLGTIVVSYNNSLTVGKRQKEIAIDSTGNNYTFDVSGNVSIQGKTDMCGNVTIRGKTDICGNVSVHGQTDISGNVSVKGQTDIRGKVNVQGKTDISGNVSVQGKTDISGNVSVQGKTHISGNVLIDGGLVLTGNINSSNISTLNTKINELTKTIIDLSNQIYILNHFLYCKELQHDEDDKEECEDNTSKKRCRKNKHRGGFIIYDNPPFASNNKMFSQNTEEIFRFQDLSNIVYRDPNMFYGQNCDKNFSQAIIETTGAHSMQNMMYGYPKILYMPNTGHHKCGKKCGKKCNSYDDESDSDSDSESEKRCKKIENKCEKYSGKTETPIKIRILGESTTIKIQCGLSYMQGDNVSVCSIADNNDYFQGYVQYYDPKTGYIAISQIKFISGKIGKSEDIYIVSLLTVRPDLDVTTNRINDLYKYLFNVDLNDTNNSNFELESYLSYNYIIALYAYFFDEDITTDGDFDSTDDYFNDKINFLYYEFFGDATKAYDPTKTPSNPNVNRIKLSTLAIKVSQFYLYFFNNNLTLNLGFRIIQ